jgi:hypothetical protein
MSTTLAEGPFTRLITTRLQKAAGQHKRVEGWHKRAEGWHKRAEGWHKRVEGWHKKFEGQHKRVERSLEQERARGSYVGVTYDVGGLKL